MEAPCAHIEFAGQTALVRGWEGLRRAGYWCEIGRAPDAASPCGLALMVRAADVEAARRLLGTMGLSIIRVTEPAAIPAGWPLAPAHGAPVAGRTGESGQPAGVARWASAR